MIRKIIPWIVFALFAFYLTANNLNAKLGIIDDHEIAMFLGSDGRIPVYEIPQVIMSTEVGQWGEYLRYRPSYYTFRVLEASLWHDNAALWYGARFVILAVSMILMWLILNLFFPRLVSYFIIFYIFTMPFWPDILTRLGPSEIYAMPALLLFTYGLVKNKMWMWIAGYAICVSAKENLLILFPVLLLWTGYQAITKKLSRRELAAVMVLTLITIFIGTGIVLATTKAGADVYGTKINYRYSVTKLLYDLPTIIKTRHMLPSLLALGAAIIVTLGKIRKDGWKKVIGSRTFRIILAMATIIMMIASQYVFYPGQIPTLMRYDFPVMPLFTALDLLAVVLVLELTKKLSQAKLIKFSLLAGLVALSSFYIAKRKYALIHQQANINVTRTQSFDRNLNQAVSVIKDNPGAKINFEVVRAIDFEPIVSVARYLNSKGLSNEFRLSYTPERVMNDPLGSQLQARLLEVKGGKLGSDGIFERFSKHEDTEDKCYSITFGPAKPLPACPSIASF